VRIVSAPDALPSGQDMRAVMDVLHRDLASQSPLATHVEIAGANHITLVTDEDHARAVGRIAADLLQEIDAH
jgi:phosphoglycerate dehydrogenase-like enzyme